MQQPKTPVRDIAKGKWPSILSQCGVHDRYLSGKHTECPICKDGTDCYRFDNSQGNGSYFCNKCGHGDGFMFLERFLSMDFSEVAKKIENIAGSIQIAPNKKKISTQRASDLVNRHWNEAKPMQVGDEAYCYLTNRGLSLEQMPKSLRLHPGLEYKDGDEVLGKYPAIIAMVVNPDGNKITLHRTYLHNGAKAPVPKPKKMLPVADGITINGSAIRTAESGEVLGVAEGLETAWAARELFNIPVWSCISANGIETFEIPEKSNVKKLIIFSDNDQNFAGQKAAYVLANKTYLRKKIEIEVRIPPIVGDWLDVLVAKHRGQS